MPVTMLVQMQAGGQEETERSGDARWSMVDGRWSMVGQQSQAKPKGTGRRCGVSFFSCTLFGLHVQHTRGLLVVWIWIDRFTSGS